MLLFKCIYVLKYLVYLNYFYRFLIIDKKRFLEKEFLNTSSSKNTEALLL